MPFLEVGLYSLDLIALTLVLLGSFLTFYSSALDALVFDKACTFCGACAAMIWLALALVCLRSFLTLWSSDLDAFVFYEALTFFSVVRTPLAVERML